VQLVACALRFRTVIAVTDTPATGNAVAVWRAKVEPFGKATVDEDPDGNGAPFTLNVRFPGQYADAETGWHSNFFRTYDPNTGRYLEADPIGLDAGVNLFSYVSNDPINDIDPYGLIEYFTLKLNSRPTTSLDCECGERYSVFSGLGEAANDPTQVANANAGPIPTGRFYITQWQSGGHLGRLRDWARRAFSGNDPMSWMTLIPIDGNSDDCTVVDGGLRCHFRAHPGSASRGCVTFTSESEFFQFRQRLLQTAPGVIPGTRTPYLGVLTVR
jgi:RHS repeat-associated protein